jgi:hypothetical protein
MLATLTILIACTLAPEFAASAESKSNAELLARIELLEAQNAELQRENAMLKGDGSAVAEIQVDRKAESSCNDDDKLAQQLSSSILGEAMTCKKLVSYCSSAEYGDTLANVCCKSCKKDDKETCKPPKKVGVQCCQGFELQWADGIKGKTVWKSGGVPSDHCLNDCEIDTDVIDKNCQVTTKIMQRTEESIVSIGTSSHPRWEVRSTNNAGYNVLGTIECPCSSGAEDAKRSLLSQIARIEQNPFWYSTLRSRIKWNLKIAHSAILMYECWKTLCTADQGTLLQSKRTTGDELLRLLESEESTASASGWNCG